MIQKCKKCGRWNSAPYEKSQYALGRFIDGLLGCKGGAEFKCECGESWMETDKKKDQTYLYQREKSAKLHYTSSPTKEPLFSDETKHTAIHLLHHLIG